MTYQVLVDCAGEIANSFCTTIIPDEHLIVLHTTVVHSMYATCACKTNFDHYFNNNGVYKAAVNEDYFDIYEDVKCVPRFPCAGANCVDVNNRTLSCVVEDVIGIPTAFCQCDLGYGDLDNDSKPPQIHFKIEAAYSYPLTCLKLYECDAATYCWFENQDCIRSDVSVACLCKTGWLVTGSYETPCIECGGVGAIESNGACLCTGVTNAVLAIGTNSLCACADGYTETNGSCITTTTTNTTTATIKTTTISG